MRRITVSLLVVCFVAAGASSAVAQQRSGTAQSPAPSGGAGSNAPTAPTETGVRTPPGYVIGIMDAFDVVVWKEKDMSAENVVVRPDGKISLPLVNDIYAVGLTVEQLRSAITEQAAKFLQGDPTVSVVVKQINSRRVSISGQVAKPGQYPLLDRMTVVDLISLAGGAAEYAKTKNIRITRKTNGKTESKVFNYKEFLDGKQRALDQNIELLPGDIVTVP